ncbi:MAG: twin-arginine translocase TatA/TatE family subunit [Desulfobacterales bacterium]
MFGLGMPELIVVLVIILIIFGAGKMPEIGSGIGKGIRNFKKAISSDDTTSDQVETPEKEKEKK